MIPSTRVTTQSGIAQSDAFSDEFAKRRIYITGEINENSAADICIQINTLASQSSDDITLIINSPGGSVSEGLAIYDTMKTCKCDVSTVVLGQASSMGALLASSGTKGKRFIAENAEMMIHQPLGGASGQASDIEKAACHISKIKRKLHLILAKNSGQTPEQITEDCDRDYWLDAEEAISYGLADTLFEGFET